ncbi:hypothetical protein [Edaphobacter flagellatus]|uniref:hypothetical protein n=1 Tax=Edaphobacter flagellatus TaxID=1933044 RepID=UPI0021B1E9EF|nr:hypothetical protein [Edaphobacter flagellatus]
MRKLLTQSGLICSALHTLALPLVFCGALVAQAVDTSKQDSGSATKQTQAATATNQKSTSSSPMTPAEKRRADLQADTEKLYRLTQELKAEVEKSNKDTLSVSVIKKAQEVEQLAKSIKERSKNP